jgi:tRNA/tmRNA/rRNA uracil-C5-methylase (TrmA/RlmC/RlmD family)
MEENEREEAGAILSEWEVLEVGAIETSMAAEAVDMEVIELTYEEAKKRPDWPKWRQAIKTELGNLKEADTWTLIERLKDANVVDSKWVLRIKKNALGQIEKYKVRLVAQGFTQIYGQDYFETFMPVARLASI